MKMKSILAVSLAAACALTSAQAATLYFDNFDGDGATNVAGTTPDTTMTVAGSPATWVANGNTTFKANGDATGLTTGGIYLPFVPTAGSIYTLSADITNITNPAPGANANDWIALGFTKGAGNTTFNFNGALGLGDALIRLTRGNNQGQYFAGVQTGNQTNFTTPTGTLAVAITLDASDANSALWTQSLSINGSVVALNSNQPTAGNSFADITHVGLGSINTAVGTVDNFSLTSVPEPSVALLGGIGVIGLLRRHRAQIPPNFPKIAARIKR